METKKDIDVWKNNENFCRDFYGEVLIKFREKINNDEVFNQAMYLIDHPELNLDFVNVLKSYSLQKEYKERLKQKLIEEDCMESTMASELARKYIISLKKFIGFTQKLS